MNAAGAQPADLASAKQVPPVPCAPAMFAWAQVPWLAPAALVLAAWAQLWNRLRIDWSTNEQYQYGWFVPPLALVLISLRWVDRPTVSPAPRVRWLALLCVGLLVLLLPLRLVEEPNPDWRLLGWLHAGVLTLLSLSVVAWLRGWSGVRHFAFPLAFLLLAVPWPSGLEQAIVQSLMRGVAAIAAEWMNVLGIPARAQGNLIHIRDQTVGVSEACSGIRSLQASLMAGLLLGEMARLSWLRRSALLLAGLLLALVANVFRSSLLVWIAARHGAAALDQVHDFAGLSVLLIVFVGLLGMNGWLSAGQPRVVAARVRPAFSAAADCSRRVPAGWLIAAGIWLVTAELTTAAWYSQPASNGPPAGWTVTPPTAPPYKNVPIDHRTTEILRYDQEVSAHWSRPGPPPIDFTLFFFRWDPGHASTTQAEMHQPHVCLTASGMTQLADHGIHPVTLPDGVCLPVRSYEFTLHGRTLYVFFVAWRDGRGGESLAAEAGSRWDRLRAVLEHRANRGRQTLELVELGAPNSTAAEHAFEEEIAALVRPVVASTPVSGR
jgi:exosortase